MREFKGRKFLSTSKTESKVKEIPDIGQVEIPEKEEVKEEESSSGGLAKLVKEVRVVGVDRFTHYSGCLKCFCKGRSGCG